MKSSTSSGHQCLPRLTIFRRCRRLTRRQWNRCAVGSFPTSQSRWLFCIDLNANRWVLMTWSRTVQSLIYLFEKIVLMQLAMLYGGISLLTPKQSAFKRFHFTESVLTIIISDFFGIRFLATELHPGSWYELRVFIIYLLSDGPA